MSIVDLALDWFGRGEQWQGPDGIPTRLLEHLGYSGLSLLLATLIALPLGLLIGHTGRGAFLAVNTVNAARALPTLGLLVLVVLGWGIGLVPALVALVALAVPPVLVNTYEGIRGVDPDTVDAARGMGMTGAQVLIRVELPAALPLILLGMRSAAIQIISTATIAAYVSLGGLGRFIIDGLARSAYESVVGGALLVMALAILTEAAFVLLGRLVVSPGLQRRSSAL
jgi:osmoprotectant transport system permease protein